MPLYCRPRKPELLCDIDLSETLTLELLNLGMDKASASAGWMGVVHGEHCC